LTVMALTRRIDLPLLWSAQEQALGLRWFTHVSIARAGARCRAGFAARAAEGARGKRTSPVANHRVFGSSSSSRRADTVFHEAAGWMNRLDGAGAFT
jgi:hypothetical protein